MRKEKTWSLSIEALSLVAARFKVLSEPVRLHILQQLENGRLSVNSLASATGTTQPNVSKHLKILQEAGLVTRKQDGNLAYYSIADQSVFELCDVVCNSLRSRLAERSSMFG